MARKRLFLKLHCYQSQNLQKVKTKEVNLVRDKPLIFIGKLMKVFYISKVEEQPRAIYYFVVNNFVIIPVFGLSKRIRK